jgi:small subunit ribosomal protein S18
MINQRRKSGKPHFRRRYQVKRFCKFCADKALSIDYKDIKTLRAYLTERGKITARRMTNTCAKHQRELTTAIKRARTIALLPFVEK